MTRRVLEQEDPQTISLFAASEKIPANQSGCREFFHGARTARLGLAKREDIGLRVIESRSGYQALVSRYARKKLLRFSLLSDLNPKVGQGTRAQGNSNNDCKDRPQRRAC